MIGHILAILISLGAMWAVYALVSIKLLKRIPFPLKKMPRI
jgi:hypothetical protein